MSFDHSRQFIGASECSAIVGLDPYRSAVSVYERIVNGVRSEDSALSKRGRALEAGLIRYYETEHGRSITAPIDTKTHHKYAFLGATPDAMDGEICVECKAPSPRSRWAWDGSDIPERYVVQAAIQAEVFRAPRTRIVVDIGDRIDIRDVEYDAELAGSVIEQVEKFWTDHVVPKRPPPADGTSSYDDFLARRFPRSGERLIDADESAEAIMRELREAQDSEKLVAERVALCKQRLQEMIGDGRGIRGSGWSATWSTTSGRETIDTKRLRAEMPEIADRFAKKGADFRTFRVSGGK